jgi:hypothetical protein
MNIREEREREREREIERERERDITDCSAATRGARLWQIASPSWLRVIHRLSL